MADFNPATMIDVTRPSMALGAVFTGSIESSTGILSVSSYQSGQIASQMTLTTNGFNAVVVTDKLTPQAGEVERWQTYRVVAGVYGSVTNGVLDVQSVWRGSIPVMSGYEYLFLTGSSSAYGMSAVSVNGSGIGAYNLTLATGLNVSPRRMMVYYQAEASQNISSATFTGVWDWEAVSALTPTANQSAALKHLGLAAESLERGLYFPPGGYLGIPSSGCSLYGKSSSGADTQRSILRADYNAPIWDMEVNPKAVQDLRLEGIRLNTCSTLTGCYIWMPDAETTFTGRVSGTTLTVEALPADGFITVGQTLKSGNTTLGTITGLLSGSPNTVGSTFTLSASVTVATGSTLTATIAIDGRYFHTADGDATIRDNVWSVPGVYITLYLRNPRNLLLHNNEFVPRSGRTWHVVRVEPSDGLANQLVLTHNKIHRHCITGIFVISNRLAPIRNIVMDWNEVSLNEEEALSLDGIGDSVGYVPVICNGRLTSLSNRSDGRLVVSLAQMLYVPAPGTTALSPVSVRCENVVGYVSGDVLSATTINTYTAIRSLLKGSGVPSGTQIVEYLGLSGSTHSYRLNKSFTLGSVGSPVTMRQGDWNKFNFVFSSGTGADGAIAGIVDYDESANTLTLDSTLVAGTLTTGATTWAGVHAGFFGGSVCHNKIGGHSKSGLNVNGEYSTAISLYLNVCGMDVAHNEVNGQANGIKVMGGFMQSAYHLLAYNNSLHDNLVVGSDVGVLSIYTGLPQVGNRVYANTIINGKVNLLGETNTLCEGNILVGDNAKVIRTYVTPTLPAIPS